MKVLYEILQKLWKDLDFELFFFLLSHVYLWSFTFPVFFFLPLPPLHLIFLVLLQIDMFACLREYLLKF